VHLENNKAHGKALSLTTRRAFAVGLFFIVFCSVRTAAQDVEASKEINSRDAAAFCANLQQAVRDQDATRVSKWIQSFPIEIQQGKQSTLIVDDTDFIRRFDLIFNSDMKSVLFGPSGCNSESHEDWTVRFANSQIIIFQTESMPAPLISAITPPKDADPFPKVSDKEYERGAQNFFKQLQRAIKVDDRAEVVAMCRFPIGVAINDKRVLIQNRAELIEKYTSVFTPGVKKAIADLDAPIHMGWRGFMTDRGEVWLDSVAWTHVYRIGAINGSPFAKQGSERKP
jgi:hypothetical protein